MIRIRFVTAGKDDFTSVAISAAQFGFWASHVDAILSDGRYVGAHYVGGVEARPKGYDDAWCARELIVELSVDQAIQDTFETFILAQLGKGYDVGAIAGFITQRDWQVPDCWFCSELVAAGLMECGYLRKLATEANKITPRDLLLILSGKAGIGTVTVRNPPVSKRS